MPLLDGVVNSQHQFVKKTEHLIAFENRENAVPGQKCGVQQKTSWAARDLRLHCGKYYRRMPMMHSVSLNNSHSTLAGHQIKER